MPDDQSPRTSEFKAFQFGGPDTEPVVLADENANIGDAIATFNELHEARRTANLPGNEDFVEAITQAFREDQERLERVVALMTLDEILDLYAERMERAQEKGERDVFAESVVFQEEEDGNFVVDEEEMGEKVENWTESPPSFCTETAADFLDEINDWEEWGEWTATHVMYWAARDVNKSYWEDGTNPEDVPEEEWDRQFNEQLTVQRYFSDAAEILGSRIAETISEGFRRAVEGRTPSLFQIEKLLGLHEDKPDAPAPRPESPDYDPDPFTGPNETAGLLAGPFSNAVRGALMDAQGEPAETKVGEWGRGPGGAPVRVEKLKNPYEGRAVLKVQAHSDADPAEVEAAMGWEMLERMDMDTVWLHSVLLAHASAPHRRGNRETMTIPRRRVENALGIRQNRNMTVRERAERVKKHVEALQSLYVQFQGVRRHGEKLHFEGDMTASPLWFVQMKARGQKDLFTGEVTADWHLKAKEGVWGSEFLHGWENPQWAPLPKEWFDQIDRRGKDWTQRLAVALLFLFRINAKRGGVVKLSAGKMLEVCGTDMSGSSRRGTERKRRLSKSLDALARDYNIDVRAEAVHIDNTSGVKHSEWKNRVATFYPPEEMSGELFRNETDGRPPLPEVKGGDWTAAQIKRLRSDLGDTQSEFADRLGISRQMVSRYENRHDPPSNKICKLLDRLDSRFR